MRLSPLAERTFIVEILVSLGVSPDHAAHQAHLLVEGDLRGHASHGLQRLPILVERLRAGLAAAEPEIDLRWATPSILQVDGGRGLGPVVAFAALDELIGRVADQGVVVAGIRNANHLGMLAPYLEYLTERSLIGLGSTTSEPLVHPWGGRDAMIGTNPIGIAVPTSMGPAVLDMATGAISAGAVRTAALRGETLPEGCAVDQHGSPTTNPSAAILGAISPFGGAKGFGLGLMLELLVGAMTSTALGQSVTGTLDSETVCNKGDLFICIDPVASGGATLEHLGRFIEEIHNAAPSPGSTGVQVPGDRARKRRDHHLEVGVEISTATWEQVSAIAGELGVWTPTQEL